MVTSKSQVVGLTGGIACGKSTVARLLVERGAVVVDADQLARDVVAPGTSGLDAIVEAFGKDVLNDAGELDREALGAIVFADDAARKSLNQITHPRIAQATMQAIAGYRGAGEARIVYDAALIVENKMHSAFRPLIVVSAKPEVQLKRLMERNSLSEDEAQARIASQLPLAEKEAVADIVIDNSDSLVALEARVDEVVQELDAWEKRS